MKMIQPDFKNPSLEIDLKQENRMDRKISLRLCLLYVLFLLYVSGLVGVVGAQPTATAWIVSPERDQKIGGRVEMRCVASNLEEDHVVEWETKDPAVTLRWGNVTFIANPRFMFETKQTGNGEITQEFSINDLQSGDDDEYVCSVNDPIPGGGHRILASITIRLRVYSSNESFPVCSPDGPITVDARTQLNLSCASDTGSPHIDISQQPPPTVFTSYQWRVLISIGLSSRSLDLIVDVSDDNLTFVCTIQSVTFYGELPVHLHSCIIGPIHVVSVFPTTKDTARLPKSTTDLVGVVGAQPTATAWIVSPERDQKIGGRVEMRCVASNLEEDHVVEWGTKDPITTLRWGNVIVTTNPRFMFDTKQTGIREITQEFSITNLQRSDDNEYICHVREPLMVGGTVSVANSAIRLRVYSSNESFPICSPDGPITVDEGAQLNMSCTSDTGSPQVNISQQPEPMMVNSYPWSSLISDGISFRSLGMTVGVKDDNLTFVCTILSISLPGEFHSCIIGPIHVLSVFPTTKDTARQPKSTTDLASEIRGTMIIESSPLAPWIASFVVAIVLLALSCVVIIILTLQIFKQRRLISSLTEKVSVPVPKSDPYTELHPTDDSNTAYTEPVTKGSTSTRHTYYNTIDIENEKTADDYEQPEDKYEAVGAP